MKKSLKNAVIYIIFFALIIVATMSVWDLIPSEDVTYSDICSYFENEQVKRFEVNASNNLELVLYHNENGKEAEKIVEYKLRSLEMFREDVGELVLEQHEKGIIESYDFPAPTEIPVWVSFIPYILVIIALVAIWVYFAKQASGGPGSKMGAVGRAKAKLITADKAKVYFKDVAGADEEKAELEEIVEFLRNPSFFTKLGAKIPHGVLLMGPPGTGKTLLARAVAGEAGCPFFSISGSDFVEMFVGVGASRVRDLFEQAKKNSPAIIFIDEIDAVGRHRGAGLGGGHDEREQTLNQLLVEMDGFTGKDNVIVIAATNRRDILDPALLRPGRFDREIVVGYSDVVGREALLKVHPKNKPLAADVELNTIAKTTAGFTGADLENLVNEASLLAARKNKKAITMDEIEEATIKVVAGPEKKSHKKTEEARKLTAYHEAGHAVCTYYCEHHDKVHQVSIIQRGMAGGYTMYLPDVDKDFVSKKEMEEQLITLMGGRAAEYIFLDDISTGASNDIERATATARKMITRYGFSEKLGPMVYGSDQHEVFLGKDIGSSRDYSEKVAADIDAEVRGLIETGYAKAIELLKTHADQVHSLAKYLLIHEKIDRDDFEKLMEGKLPESAFEDVKPAETKAETPAEESHENADKANTENTTEE